MFRGALLRHELARNGAKGFRSGVGCSGMILMTRDGCRQVGIGRIGVGSVTVMTVLLTIYLLAHLDSLVSNPCNHYATWCGFSCSHSTSHCALTLSMLFFFSLSIPTQEYDLERAICMQGHPQARISSKFLFFLFFFTLIGIRTLHPALASVSSFFFAFCLYSFVSAGTRTQRILASTVSLSKFLFMFMFFVYTHPCLH